MSSARTVATLLVVLSATAHAQTKYEQPPAPIAAILDAPPVPAVRVSPDNRTLLILDRAALPPIAEVAAPELRLAGDRINPVTDAPSRAPTLTGLRLQSVAGGPPPERPVALTPHSRILDALWSPDSHRIAAIVQSSDSALTLWLVDATTGSAHMLSTRPLNAAAGTPCRWLPADAGLICRFRATDRGPAPPLADALPTGPIIQVSSGHATANVTYEDLLQSPADEARFDYYYTAQIARVALDGTITPLGAPGVYVTSAPSPDGHDLLVQTLHRPYSYQVPRERFPTRTEVWDLAANGAHTLIADRPLQEAVPSARDAVPIGPRDVAWRPDAGATLAWAEAVDGGDPSTRDSIRDVVKQLGAPFAGSPTIIASLRSRFEDADWANPNLALVTEQWWKTRRKRTWAIDPTHPTVAPRLVFDRSSEDRYADPGQFVTTGGAFGWPVLRTASDGRSAYLTGDGASADGDRPFLDRIDLTTFRTTRLWRSAAPYYATVAAVLDPAAHRVVIRRESVTDAPNYFAGDLPKGPLAQLTHFADPAPQFAGVTKQLITYQRADGVQLSATLYLPAGYTTAQGPLPFFFWAYPQEFKSAAAAAQVIGSPYRFTRPVGASELFLLTQGYGVLDGPTMPIVGQGDAEPNDTYVQQLVSSAQAAVDKVVSMGVADRSRIAVGGHSYGAFMTANLLVHSTLFRTGIARSGAYNRTLTPFGFQNEERSYWQARDIYTRMSPFTYADSLHAPLLLIHGLADDNTGTFPIQSERFYAALSGHGATVRLVMLPAEAHGYRGRESVGHTLWEMVRWLDTYVKNAKPVS